MISFNGPRPEKDGTWSRGAKYGLVSVVIHEVGHNWFPMIINSDERQWTWMDEGLNTFMQYLAEQEWEAAFESGRGEPAKIVGHMTSAQQTPKPRHEKPTGNGRAMGRTAPCDLRQRATWQSYGASAWCCARCWASACR